MPVIAVWSAPRSRSTAFFRAMVERGDLVTIHEPFSYLAMVGRTSVRGRVHTSAGSVLASLRRCAGAAGPSVLVKDTTDRRHVEVLADQRFLGAVRHLFLLRRPEEIAASYAALAPVVDKGVLGVEALHELYVAVQEAGGSAVVVDSDDLVDRPAVTMQAVCAAVGLPHRAGATTWKPGERAEWATSARWHRAVEVSSGFERREQHYRATVDTSEALAHAAAHHRPFYERLRAVRLDVGGLPPSESRSQVQ